jgi:hypothetical protein
MYGALAQRDCATGIVRSRSVEEGEEEKTGGMLFGKELAAWLDGDAVSAFVRAVPVGNRILAAGIADPARLCSYDLTESHRNRQRLLTVLVFLDRGMSITIALTECDMRVMCRARCMERGPLCDISGCMPERPSIFIVLDCGEGDTSYLVAAALCLETLRIVVERMLPAIARWKDGLVWRTVCRNVRSGLQNGMFSDEVLCDCGENGGFDVCKACIMGSCGHLARFKVDELPQ